MSAQLGAFKIVHFVVFAHLYEASLAWLYSKKSKQKEQDMENTENSARVHTDLACERMRADTALEGVEYSESEEDGCRIARLTVTSDEGAKSIGRPKGRYVTMSFSPLYELTDDTLSSLSSLLSRLIGEFVSALDGKVGSVLAVGLGNRYMTSDAVGPESIREMLATRHLFLEDPELFAGYSDVVLSLLSPGVMAQTGIESRLLVEGAVKAIQPDLVIVIDALAARSTDRLATTIQLSDTGIRPGSGIGNSRLAIDREALGVPVLAIGIPTVVDSRTLVYDALERAGATEDTMPPRLYEVLAEGESFFVSPRQMDTVTERAARLVADAVNLTFSAGFLKAAEQ